MEKFRKKPVEIQAVLWDGSPESWNEIQNMGCNPIQDESCSTFEMIIPTLEDGSANQVRHIATKGDYIIKGVAGEFYPCKPEIFASTYSKVLTSFEDIFIRAGRKYQISQGIEPESEEDMRKDMDDPDFQLLKNAVQEYALQVAKDTLAKAAENVKHVPQMYAKLMETQIVLP